MRALYVVACGQGTFYPLLYRRPLNIIKQYEQLCNVVEYNIPGIIL